MTPDDLKEWQLLEGLTIAEAADKFGVDAATFKRWKAGKMRQKKLVKLAAIAISAGMECADPLKLAAEKMK